MNEEPRAEAFVIAQDTASAGELAEALARTERSRASMAAAIMAGYPCFVAIRNDHGKFDVAMLSHATVGDTRELLETAQGALEVIMADFPGRSEQALKPPIQT